MQKERALFTKSTIYKIGTIVKVGRDYFLITSAEPSGTMDGVRFFQYFGIPHNPTPVERFHLRINRNEGGELI